MKKKDTLYYTNQRRKARNGIPKEGVREDAINELLKSMKLDSKISTIKQFIEQIRK